MDPSPSTPGPEMQPDRTVATGAGSPLRVVLSGRIRGVPILTIGLLAFAASVLVGNYLPARASSAATEHALGEQRRENRALTERIRVAEAGVQRLEKDPWTHERFLRDKLHMTRPGEILVR